ncbi:MAG: hypothetical protein FD155_1650 [Bacteroidetes bacterium]|nr:MAG: hypothetical protein FD155_1650 [Bacteroidota bacterium]
MSPKPGDIFFVILILQPDRILLILPAFIPMSNKILLPTAYFPPILWIALAVQSEETWLEYFETFPKQTIRNRCFILSANGPLLLSVPVVRTNGNHSKTVEMQLAKNEQWQNKHFRAIMSAYSKSPYFYFYSHHFEAFYQSRFDSLIEVNLAAIDVLKKILKTTTFFIPTNDWQKDGNNLIDFRSYFDTVPDQHQEVVKPYLQVFSDRFPFNPDLSVLDLIFNEGPSSLSYLKNLDLQPILDKQSLHGSYSATSF